MTEKELLEQKIDALKKLRGAIHYNSFESNIDRISKYIEAFVVFLLYIYENHFDDKGKFKINILQWPKVIKQVVLLIKTLIKI